MKLSGTLLLKGAKSVLLWVASFIAMAIMIVFYTVSILVKPLQLRTSKQHTSLHHHRVNSKNENRLIIVTGTDSGIGRALAELLNKIPTFHVLALTCTDYASKELNFKYESKRFAAKKCDVTSNSDIESVRQYVMAQLGENDDLVLFGLINNAAICDPGDFVWDQYMKTAERTMDVNYFGVLRLTHALLPTMVFQNKGGRIINVTSVNGVVPVWGNSAYSASKFAVEGWNEALRKEVACFGITVSCVRPGSFKTDIHKMIRDRVLQNFRAASEDVQDIYGGEKYLKKWDTLNKRATAAGQSPDIVAHLLYDILLVKKPKAVYWAGLDSAILFRALHILPTAVSDFVLDSLIDLKPLNADKPKHMQLWN